AESLRAPGQSGEQSRLRIFPLNDRHHRNLAIQGPWLRAQLAAECSSSSVPRETRPPSLTCPPSFYDLLTDQILAAPLLQRTSTPTLTKATKPGGDESRSLESPPPSTQYPCYPVDCGQSPLPETAAYIAFNTPRCFGKSLRGI